VRANGESDGESPGRDSNSDDEDGDKGEDLLHKLFEDGGELRSQKFATGCKCKSAKLET